MKSLNLESGGFPGTIKTFKQLRDMTEQVAHVVSQMCGNLVIVSGVEDQGGGIYSDGWVVIEGELLPFVGGSQDTHIRIVEAVQQVQYLKDEDNDGIGDFVDGYIERYATFGNLGSALPLYELENFERYENTGKVAKSGVLIIEPSTNTASVVGDFISVETLTPGNLFDNYQYYQVNFEDINSEYDVLITPMTSTLGPGIDWSFNTIFYALSSKLSESFKISVRSAIFSSISSVQGQIKYQISLIKKV